MVALDNRTGQIRVMVGGQNFARSKFNRATQARRQVGSLFKPIVYATALDQGFTAASTFIDEPVSYDVGPEPAALSAARTTTASSRDSSRCATRSSSRATFPP